MVLKNILYFGYFLLDSYQTGVCEKKPSTDLL